MSFLARILLLVFAAVMVPIAIQTYSELSLRQEREAEFSRASLSQAQSAAAAVAAIADGIKQTLIAVASSPTIRHFDPAACHAYLEEVQKRNESKLVLTVLNAQGLVMCRSDQPVIRPDDNSDQELFERVRATQSFAIGDYGIARATGREAIHLSYPVFDAEGKFAGSVTVPLDLDMLAQALPHSPLPPNSKLLLFDRKGTILVDLPEHAQVGKTPPEPWSSLGRQEPHGTRELQGPLDNVRRIVGYARVDTDPGPLLVAVGFSRDAVFARIDAATQHDAMYILLGMVFALLAAWFLARYGLQRPVFALNHAAEAWRSGDTSARTGLKGASELDRLGQTFDRMAEALQARDRERQQHEKELRQSRDDAIRANLSKSRFIAAANHDLRQPLHSIGMAISLLEMRHGGADEDMVDLARLKRAVQSLETLLDSLLDISDLEAGLIRPTVSDFDLHTVLRPVCEVFEEPARRKAVSFTVGDCHAAVRSDAHLLGRMLRNLISNAVKFTNPDGKVSVSCVIGEEAVIIEIRDTGIGITEDRRAQIFEPFFHSDNAPRDRSAGHGLGLAIVDRISKLLEHPVRVESQPGKGSLFSVEVPRAPQAAPASREQARTLSGHVLLVEDDTLVAESTAALLRAWGAEVQIASSGAEAMERIRGAARGFDVVMVDYRLPDMSGKEVINAARKAWPAARTLVITGDSVDADLQALEAAGTGLLQKPVGAQALLNAVSARRKA